MGSRWSFDSSLTFSAEMTWTSIGPDRRMTRLITEPCVSSCHQDRPLAPSTICVAFSARANSIRAVATSLPVTSRYAPPSSSSSRRCSITRSVDRVDSPVSDWTCTPNSSPWARCAMRAARRMSWLLPGAPVMATTTRSRVSQGWLMPCRARYSSSATSTWSATHSRASSRRAVRLPARK
jgi:hypothetical protein